MRYCLSAVAASLALLITACPLSAMPPLETPEDLQMERYMGTWYSVASFPKFFELGCRCSQAQYSLNTDGTVDVVNSCLRFGELDSYEGTARQRQEGDPARLEVSFFGPFWWEYTIIHVTDDYQHAVVGTRDRNSLWFLSRKRQPSQKTIEELKCVARKQGFDVTELEMIEQNCD